MALMDLFQLFKKIKENSQKKEGDDINGNFKR